MKVTRLGPTRELISIGSVLGGGGSGSGTPEEPAPSGQVPTSNGSNSVAWGSNVATISAGGSNLLGPFLTIAAGSNITLTIDAGPLNSTPSNTLRIHSTGGGTGIDRPLMAYNATASNYLVVVAGDGTAVMVEDT